MRPELAVGVGVRWKQPEKGTPDYGYGWLVDIGKEGWGRVAPVDGSDDFPVHTSGIETVPDDEMPPYQPPAGIEASAPPEVVERFRINGVWWALRGGDSWTHGEQFVSCMNAEQAAWLARALTAKRGQR